MKWPRVAFVAAPEVDAEVRFDFNDDLVECYPDADDFSLGAPSLSGDPDGIGVEYGLRTIEFPLIVRAHKAEALARLNALAAELLRGTNWLLVQLSDTSDPVWFQTWRASPGELSLDRVYADDGSPRKDTWTIPVSIPAESFAIGERVVLPDVTVANNPAAATNPMSFVIPDVSGDFPAPLTFTTFPSDTIRCRQMFTVSPVESFDGPHVWYASSFTAGTDTGAVVSSSGYAGGAYREVTFAGTAGMAKRASGVVPGNAIPRGRYKVLVRVVRTDTSSSFSLRFAIDPRDARPLPYGPTVDLSGESDGSWGTVVDLGEHEFPMGVALQFPYGMNQTAFDDANWLLDAERNSGSGRLRLDYLLLVPVDTALGRASTLYATASGQLYGSPWDGLYFDGDYEIAAFGYGPGFFDLAASAQSPSLEGGFPVVVPGVDNVVHFALHVDHVAQVGSPIFGARGNEDVIGVTTSVTNLSYRPRYLYLRGD